MANLMYDFYCMIVTCMPELMSWQSTMITDCGDGMCVVIDRRGAKRLIAVSFNR